MINKEIKVVQFKNARYRIIDSDTVIVESDDFRCPLDNELIPFLVKFDKNKACWVHSRFEENDLSPFKEGVPVIHDLNIALFSLIIEHGNIKKSESDVHVDLDEDLKTSFE